VIPPSRGTNPYAEQAVSAAPGGNYNQYAAPPQNYGNQYGQAQTGNPYAQQQQYGQQEQYAMGGVGGQAGGDFWSELTTTNQNLSLLQEQIQAVRTAHQKSLVSQP
jgi:syntaxin 1B/2/3